MQLREIFLTDNVMTRFLHKYSSLLSPNQLQEIQKMLLCHDPSKGFAIFQCTGCDNVEVVHLSCNSRICPSCGRHLTEQWAKSVMRRMLPVKHRHCVFTLPDELWSMMKNDRELIKIAFKLLIATVEKVFCNRYGSNLTPGMTAVLHTFGEDMKFNVHFHTLVTCGGVDTNGKWVDFNYFPYNALRKVWQYQVLTAIKDYLPKNRENAALINKLFKDHPEGFYVRAKDIIENNKEKGLLKYIARYVRHPAIAQSRITGFDGEIVTFLCDKNEEMERKVSMPVVDFMFALAQHIPPKGFQVIKHLGIYANRIRRMYEAVFSMFGAIREGVQKKLFRVRKKCPVCGDPMERREIFHSTHPPPHLLLSNYMAPIQLSLVRNLHR